jgi:thiol:disulfide interchange protein DsbG
MILNHKPMKCARLSFWLVSVSVLALVLIIQLPAMAASPVESASTSPMLALQRAHWIAVGSPNPRHVLYEFTDANCPYCHALWLAMAPYYRRGVQVRHLLVGVISASSPGKAAAILEARDPAAALRANEALWGTRADGGGGIAPLVHPGFKEMSEIIDNDMLMQDFGISGTPALIYEDRQGKVHLVEGLPGKADLTEIVKTAIVPKP